MATSSQHLTVIQRKLAVQMLVTLVCSISKLLLNSLSAFAPISQIRFWGAQVICVATPSAFFVVYSIERKHKDETKRPDCSETSAIPKRRPSHAFVNMTSAQHSIHESFKSRSCREHRVLKAYFWQGF